MLRSIATGVAFALVMLGGMASATGVAQADSGRTEIATAGTWVFVKWYKGAYSVHAVIQCENEADSRYPGQNYDCKPSPSDDTTQLWVEF